MEPGKATLALEVGIAWASGGCSVLIIDHCMHNTMASAEIAGGTHGQAGSGDIIASKLVIMQSVAQRTTFHYVACLLTT